MTIIKRISFTENEVTTKLFSDLEKIQEGEGKSFSQCAREGLQLLILTYQKPVEGVSSTEVEAIAHLDKLHARLVKPNPERYFDWWDCVVANALDHDEFTMRYSLKRGWLKRDEVPYDILKKIKAEEAVEPSMPKADPE